MNLKVNKNKIKKDITDAIENVFSELEISLRTIEKHTALKSSLEKIQDALIESIKKLKSEITSLDSYKASVQSEISNKKIELKNFVSISETTKEGYQNDIKILDTQKKALATDIEDLKKTQASQLAAVIPTLDDLKQRTKNIEKKERDIGVVVERYKKIYGEKGIALRI